MSEYSSSIPSLRGPRSPFFGTATYSTLTTSQDALSPSRRSSTLSYSDSRVSYESEEDHGLRHYNLSPVPSSRESDGYSYEEEDSYNERAEVEAALAQVDEEIDETLEAWSREPSMVDRDRRILSTISERTENLSSRPTSGVVSGPRPISSHSNNTRASQLNSPFPPTTHTRSTTDPSNRPNTPGRGVSQIIAQFEAKRAAGEGVSPFTQGHSRTTSAPAGPRSPSPYALPTTSQTLPTLSALTRDVGYATSGYGSVTGYGYTSRSSSPTKSRGGSSVSGPRPPPSGDSRASPVSHSRAQSDYSGYSGTHSRTGSISETFTGLSGTGSVSDSVAPSAFSLRRPQTSPRSPITQVTNIVAAWKGKTPVFSKGGRLNSPSPSDSGRRHGRRSVTPRTPRPKRRASDVSSDTSSVQRPQHTGDQTNANTVLPPPFDASEFGIEGDPINIGLLWYLNVHAPQPYRWQRCQAVLYPHMLLLTWIAPGGGRGIVTLDLLNCTEVRTALSPTHPESRDDVGAVAALQQTANASRGGYGTQPGEDALAETLSPFQLMYNDGIERLGTESPRERLAWVNAIWEVLERPLTIPDRSSTKSPVGSVLTMNSYASGSSAVSSGVGSASTNYISPLHSGDLADAVSLSGSSSLSRKLSVASSQLRAMDDNALSNDTYLPHADPRVIPPSRMSSLRRTSSLTDLDEEFNSALRRARNARPGLGFGLSLAAGVPMGEAAPVTVSSGPRMGSPVSLTPPPRDRSRSRPRNSETASSVSGDPFFSASGSTYTRTPATSFYSTSSFTQGLTSTGLATDETIVLGGSTTLDSITASRGVTSTTSTSLLSAPHTDTTGTTTTSISPNRTGLTRSRGVRRRMGTVSSRSLATSSVSGSTEELSDKENSASYSGSHFSSDAYPSEFSTLDTLTHTATLTTDPSYATSEDWTRSETPTPSTVSSSRPTSHFATSESDVPPPSSSRTSEYYSASAKSPTVSLASIPTIPSESEYYDTADIDVFSAHDDYVTADIGRTESVTDFDTAGICPSTPPATEYVTAEICASDISTNYETAQCHCATRAEEVPEEAEEEEQEEREVEIIEMEVVETEVSLAVETEVSEVVTEEEPVREVEKEVSLATDSATEPAVEDTSGDKTPSVVPTIPSPSLVGADVDEIRPEDIALPPSVYSPSIVSSEPLSYLEPPPPPPKEPAPPTPSLTSTPSISLPSTLEEPLVLPRPISFSSISSPTESSVTPTTSSEPSLTVPSTLEQPSVSSPTIAESVWAPETDRSYESSILRASPSTRSLAIPEGQDFSFETSILRPTSVVTSGEVSLVTPVSPITITPSATAISSSSRSSTLTVPSTPTLPPSVPEPTPVSSIRSPTPVSSVRSPTPPTPTSRTPSTISTATTPSLSSSIFAPSPLNLPPSPAPSTEPSLLSTRPSTPEEPPSPPPPDESPPPVMIPIPPSPSPPTPSASIILSVSTPRGTTPSIHSALETEEAPTTVAEPDPGQIWTDDMNRLLERLDSMDRSRGAENAGLKDDVRQIRDLLSGLRDDLGRREEPPPHSDRSVGAASPIVEPRPIELVSHEVQASLEPATPRPPVHEIRDVPTTPTPKPRAQSIIELSPPRIRSRSPDTLSETMSFLSSHHSDDFSLMESESYPIRPSSPSWSSEVSESTVSSPVSSPVSSASVRPRSERSIDRESTPSLVSDDTATPPPLSSSPTPSSASSVTARPPQPPSSASSFNLRDLRDILDDVQRRLSTLREGQDEAKQAIEEIRLRPEAAQREIPDVTNRLDTLEHLLGDVLNRLAAPAAPEAPRTGPTPQPPPVERDDGSESMYTISDGSSIFRTVRDFLDRSRREPRPIHVPTPTRAGPSFDEQLAELIASTHPVEPADIHQPPPLVPLIYRPGPRLGRPRSASPTFETDLPARPGTFPQTEPVIFERRGPRRPIPRTERAPPPRPGPPSEPEPEPPYTPIAPPRVMQTSRPGARPDSGPDIDFIQQVIDRRRARRGGDGFYFPDGRAPSAPPTLGQGVVPPPGTSWYQDRPPPTGQQTGAPVVPPPGVTNVPPAQGATPAVIQLPGVEDIVALLRENRMAQVATIEQQREIMRYMRSLNEWLERDVHDRQDELRAVSNQVASLHRLMHDVLNRQPEGPAGQPPRGEGVVPPAPIIFPPTSGHMGPPPVIPPGPGMPEPMIPVIPEQQPGRGGFPGGFVPGSGPAVIPQMPGSEHFDLRPTPSPEYPPVIPDRPPPMGPGQGVYPPVVPTEMPYPSAGPSYGGTPYRRPQRMDDEDYEDAVVPPRPSPPRHEEDYTPSGSSDMYSDGEPPRPVPPPGVFMEQPPVRTSMPQADPAVIPLPPSRPSPGSPTGSSSTEHDVHVHIHQPSSPAAYIPPPGSQMGQPGMPHPEMLHPGMPPPGMTRPSQTVTEGATPPVIIAPPSQMQSGMEDRMQPHIIIQPPMPMPGMPGMPGPMPGYSQVPSAVSEEPHIIRTSEPQQATQQPPVTVVVGSGHSRHSSEHSPSRMHYDSSRRSPRSSSRTPSSERPRIQVPHSPQQPTFVIQPPPQGPMPGQMMPGQMMPGQLPGQMMSGMPVPTVPTMLPLPSMAQTHTGVDSPPIIIRTHSRRSSRSPRRRSRYPADYEDHPRRSRSTSRSPRSHRTRSPSPRSHRTRYRSPSPSQRHRTGTEGPLHDPTVIIRSTGRRYSRSRSGSRSRSHSRSPPRHQAPAVVIQPPIAPVSSQPIQVLPSTHRSRSPTRHDPTTIVHTDSGRRRHESPTIIVRTHERGRSRSSSRTPIMVPPYSRRSRSRSPVHIPRTDRSQPIIIRSEGPRYDPGSSRTHRTQHISRSPTRYDPGSSRTHHTHRISRSPTRYDPGSSRTHHTHRISRSPTRYDPGSSRTHRTHRISRSPTRRDYSSSPRRLHRRPQSRTDRSYSPSPTRHTRSPRRHPTSRPDTRRDYPRSPGRHPTSRPHTRRDYSRSPTGRHPTSRPTTRRDRSRSPTGRHRESRSYTGYSRSSSGRRRVYRSSTRRTHSPTVHRVSRTPSPRGRRGQYVEGDRSRPTRPTYSRRSHSTPTPRRPGTPVHVGSTAPGRSPHVVVGRSRHSRSPTLVDRLHSEPITIRVQSPTRSPASAFEDPTHRVVRSPGSRPTEYSEHEPSEGRRRLARSEPHSSVAIPVPAPSGRRHPPTVITLHSQPGSPTHHVVHVPSSQLEYSPHRSPSRRPSSRGPSSRGPSPHGRVRTRSEVTQRPHSRSVERTPAAGPERISSPPSHVSDLEQAFSVDESAAPSRRAPHRRRVSPATHLREQLRPARPEDPVIPIFQSDSHVEEDEPSIIHAAPSEPSILHVAPSEPRTTVSESPLPVPAPIPEHIPSVPSTHAPLDTAPITVPATAAPSSPRHPPVVVVPSQRYSAPQNLDLDLADAERERAERFDQAHMQLAQHMQAAEEAEEERERHFRDNEEARQRIFEENEARRQQEIQQHQDEYLRQIEDRVDDRLAGLPTVAPIPVPPPQGAHSPHAPSYMSVPASPRPSYTASVPVSEEDQAPELPAQTPPPPPFLPPSTAPEDVEDVQTIAQSLHHSVLDAASRHSQDMLETLRLEREEMHRQLDEERAERERRNAELAAMRDERENELMERIRQLEERLATTEAAHEQTKADLDQERQLRITEETERREAERAEDRQRADDAMLQLSELTNVATETRDELARKREVSDERWSQKEVWKEEKDRDMAEMKEMLSNMQRMFQDSEQRREEERAMEASKPSIESILDELRRENEALRALFAELTQSLREENKQNLESVLGAVRSTAQEQVPYNISGYLDEFSKTLAKEVRQLLTEVNELVENKTRLQFEIATLLEFKARYEPGGFFWKQGSQMPPATAPPAEAPPPDQPPPPAPEPAQAPPAWRTTRPRRGRKAREQAAAAPSAAPAPPPPMPQHMMPPSMMPQDARSWHPWQPSSNYVPSPSSQLIEPLPAPPPQDTRPMGLFGPRSQHSSYIE